MYCPSCGSEQVQGLKYCKRCGANLAPASEASSSRLGTMVWALSLAIAIVSIGGLALIFMFAMEVIGRSSSSTGSYLLLLLFMLVVLVIATLLIRQLSRLLSVHLQSTHTAPPPQALSGETPRSQLHEPQPSVIGDLEQTTRRLDPTPREQKR